MFYTDEEAEARISTAAKKAVKDRYQDVKEALEAQGFDVKGLGSELKPKASTSEGPQEKKPQKKVRFQPEEEGRDLSTS